MRFQSLFAALLIGAATFSADADIPTAAPLPLLQKTPQNMLTVLQSQPWQYRITSAYEKKLQADYLSHYYQPWHAPFKTVTKKDLYFSEKHIITWISMRPGWNENFRKHRKQWALAIARNVDLPHFPNHLQRAITLQHTYLRLLPTLTPSYDNPQKAGQGYPFDNLQVSYLGVDEPVYIVQTSKNKAWDLIITNSHAFGWLRANTLASVSDQFIRKWQSAGRRYFMATNDGDAATSEKGQFYFQTRLGEIYPRVDKPKSFGEILVATRNAYNHAVIQFAKIDHNHVRAWPQLASSIHIAKQLNLFLGKPYGWGGLYGYRDCSATIRDLFSAFAIWLPRNSKAQAYHGYVTQLNALNRHQKKKRLHQRGIPLFTLLYLPGHIMLYTGNWHGQPTAFHDKWGLHTKNAKNDHKGRLLIGRTILAPLNLGANQPDIPNTLLAQLKMMTGLIPNRDLQKIPTS